jgi:hypothetical protein
MLGKWKPAEVAPEFSMAQTSPEAGMKKALCISLARDIRFSC